MGGIIPSSPASTARQAACAGSHVTDDDSVDTSRVRCPAGRVATKNQVRNRLGSKVGVHHPDQAPSRSVRSTSPRRSRNSVNESSLASSACRSVSQSSPVVSATTSSAEAPASRTPDSSNVSRTAAHTSARASSSVVASRDAQLAADGPAQATEWSESRGSTPPPGKTHIPPANAIDACRRSR